MRRLTALALALLMGTACAKSRPRSGLPAPEVTGRLARAGDLLRTGCFECLEEALAEYEAVSAVPNLRPADGDAAVDGAIRAALLLEVRERELGMADDGYLQRARELIGTRPDRAAAFTPHLYSVESLPRRDARFLGPTGPDGLRRMQELRANFPALVEERRLGADADPLAAYLWLAFYCTHSDSRDDRSLTTLLAPLVRMREAPIVDYRAATCLGTQAEPLETLLDREPRFVEINYWQAQLAQMATRIEEAEQLFAIAFKWRPRWPAVTAALGNVCSAFEEHEKALDFFD